MIHCLRYAWRQSFGNPDNWRITLEDIANCLGALVLGAVAFLAIGIAAHWLSSVAACPVHITTSNAYGYTTSDYCLHLGIGR